MTSRFQFYWREQRGKCALMITETCRMHGGQMLAEPHGKPGRAPTGSPTWEHVYPKPRTPAESRIQLLACTNCNNKRGNAPARAEYVARGLVLFEEWERLNAAEVMRSAAARAERKAAKRDLRARAVTDPLAAAIKSKREFCMIGSRAHRAWLERHNKIVSEKAQGILEAMRPAPMERKR